MTEQVETALASMDLGALDAVIARATELRQQKHAERMARLQEEAIALGATVKKNGHKGTPRGRRTKQHDA